ncbi:MAG: murein transglycosylase [Rhodococcus sp.]|nr:murein transglycosylase [Rhodococcus sp. (in: high G+C Gram-positive bacteria)]
MGRHSKKTESRLRRNSVIALAGLAPAGLVTATANAVANSDLSFFNTTADADGAAVQAAADRVLSDFSGDLSNLARLSSDIEFLAQAPQEPALAPVQETPPLPGSLAEGALGIPGILVDAYQNAERILSVENPSCNMYWTLIAGVGRVESTHAYDGKVDEHGTMLQPVLGPRLDGTLAGNATIRDTDGGALDGDPIFDRAVGPTQFLPETWNRYAADANGDGFADPQNVYDSALTTGKYLCDGGLDMRNPIEVSKAVYRYNNSAAYVANVLAWSAGYSTGIVPSSAELPRIH